MPIGSGIVYNTGDLILSQVSSSGTSFLETKIAAATSSLIYFDSTARINSASLNNISVGTASYTSGSTSIITNLTASNISASSITSSLFGTSSWSTNALTASFLPVGTYNITSSWANNSISSSFATTAQTANALNTGNSYTIAGLTNNGTLSQQGTLSMGSGYQILATAGSAPIPGIAFVGDTNTGIYSPGADTIGFVTSGSERARIDSNGNVGIGTTSAGSKLQINDTNPTLTIRANDGGVSRKAYIDFYTTFYNYPSDVGARRTSTIVTGFDTGVWGTEFLSFNVGSGSANDSALLPIERMRITGGGNVGIGTSNPTNFINTNPIYFSPSSSGTFLSLYSATNEANINLISSASADGRTMGGIYFSRASGQTDAHNQIAAIRAVQGGTSNTIAGGILHFFTKINGAGTLQTTPQMVIGTDGKVGIGTSSPGALLEVSSSTEANLINVKGAGGSSLLYVSGSGQVGIGTTSPSALLTIANATNGGTIHLVGRTSDDTAAINFRAAGDSSTYAYISPDTNEFRMYHNDGYMSFYPGGSAKVIMAANGNVGIGTTSVNSKLDIWGGTGTTFNMANDGDGGRGGKLTFISSSATGRQFYVGTNSSIYNLVFGIDSIEKMRLDINGNLGIGTTSPSYLLDVSGSSRHGYRTADTHQFTGSVSISGSLNATSSWATNALTASFLPVGTYNITSSWANNAVSASYATTAQTANSLVSSNSYLITNLTASSISASGTVNIGGSVYNDAVEIDKMDYFQLQPYIEGGNIPSNVLGTGGGTAPTFTTLTGSDCPFGKVAYNTGYYEAIGDYIPVNPGETLYGEIWAYRNSGASGTAGAFYCGISRYDKDKNPIATNLGLTYFIASGVTVPTSSTWTKYSGTTTLPLTHTPFAGSDGGPVRYVRPYIIVDYPSGTIPTYWGAWKMRKTQITRDTGTLSISGSLGIGTTSPGTKLEVVGSIRGGSFPILVTNTGEAWFGRGSDRALGSYTLQLGGTSTTGTYYEIIDRAWTKVIFGVSGEAPNNSFFLNSSGNIGIGTNLPNNKLHVYNNAGSSTTASNAIAVFEESSNAGIQVCVPDASEAGLFFSRNGAAYYSAVTRNGTDLLLKNNSTTAVTINSSGNVGIGTTTVNQNKLLIYNSTSSTDYTASTFSGGTGYFDNKGGISIYNPNQTTDNFSSLDFYIDQTNYSNVGAARIICKTGARSTGGTFDTSLIFLTHNQGGTWNQTIIDNSGRLGIGTTSPLNKLQVNGNISGSSFTSSISNAVGFLGTSSWANNVVSASFATTAQTANALNSSNTYTVAGFNADYVNVLSSATIPTTGIYRPSTKALGLSADGTLIFKISNASAPATSSIETGNFIVASGDVGIGTSNPTSQSNYRFLQVNGTNSAVIETMVGGTRIGGFDSDASNLYVGSIGSYPIVFRTAVNEKMRITSGGLVGIGTTAPSSSLTVQSNGTQLRLQTTSGPGSYFSEISARYDSTHPFGIYVANNSVSTTEFIGVYANSGGGNERVVFPTGNVGIGTTSPRALLHVNTVNGSDANEYAGLVVSATVSSSKGVNISYDATNDVGIITAVNNGVAWRDLTLQPVGGGVGIRTKSPVSLLDVRGGYITSGDVVSVQASKILAGYYNDGAIVTLGGEYSSGGPVLGYGVWPSGSSGTFVSSTGISVNRGAYTIRGSTHIWHSSTGSSTVSINSPVALNSVASLDSSGNFIVNAVTASLFGTSSWANNVVSASFATTAQTANALNTGNAYTIAGLTNNGTLSQQGTLSMGNGYQILATQGSAATPGIAFVGDTNTGLYGTGADVIGFVTNGSEKVRIDNSGNVGIGTSSPASKLEVQSGSILIRGDGTAQFGISLASAGENTFFLLHSGSGNTFHIGNDVSGTNYNTVAITAATDANGGKVGIGTVSPSSKLTVVQTTGADSVLLELQSNNDPGIRFGRSTYGSLIRHISATTDYIAFNCNGSSQPSVSATAQVVFDENGNVGIGTTSPAYKLDVSGSVRFGKAVTDAHYYTGSVTMSSGSALNFSTAGATSTTDAKIFFGINPNPLGSLNTTLVTDYGADSTGLILQSSVSGDTGGIKITDDGVAIFGAGDEDLLRVVDEDNNVMRLVINNNGLVGIGTTSPSALFEITGSSNSALMNVKSPISGAIFYISGSGAIGVGTQAVGDYRLQVSGSFAATTKSFVIEHPTKKGKKLIYGSLESPYHGIRLTGKSTIENGKGKVELPEYMHKLILHDSINIQVTGIKCSKTLYVDEINIPENYFVIAYDKGILESYKDYDFFWDFTAIRADVPELDTEI